MLQATRVHKVQLTTSWQSHELIPSRVVTREDILVGEVIIRELSRVRIARRKEEEQSPASPLNSQDRS